MKKIISLFVTVLLISSVTFGYIDGEFTQVGIEVDPVLEAGEPVDITIKAINDDGEVIKDVVDEEGDIAGDVIFEVIDGDGISEDDVEFPHGGMYGFIPEDQGTKTFSNGLKVNSPGVFTIRVSHLMESEIAGEKQIEVLEEGQQTEIKEIQIDSPSQGGTVSSERIDVIGSSDLANTPLEIYLNDEFAVDGMSDPNGDFNESIDGLKEGENTIRIEKYNKDGDLLAKSGELTFDYQPEDEDWIKDIYFTPGNSIEIGQELEVQLDTKEGVEKSKLIIQGYDDYDMEQNNNGFSKSIKIDESGEYTISAELTEGEEIKTFDDLDTVTVISGDEYKITTVKQEKVQGNTRKLSWEYEGDISQFRVEFGRNEDQLSEEKLVEENEIVFEDIQPEETIFVKIYPVDDNNEVLGQESNLEILEPKRGAASCQISGIQVNTKKQNDKYYLTWDKIENVEKYSIYRSDEKTDNIEDMEKVAETENNKFEYPFDPNAEQNEYAYYIVQAECEDGTQANIDDVTKVQVGPMNIIGIMIILSILAYLSMKLYSYTDI